MPEPEMQPIESGTKRKGITVLAIEVLVSLVLNLTASAYPDQLNPLIPYGWLLVALQITYLILPTQIRWLGGKVARGFTMLVIGYAIAGILGAGLGVVYWRGITAGIRKLDAMKGAKAGATPPSASDNEQSLMAARRQRFTEHMGKLDTPEKDVLYEFVLEGFHMSPAKAAEILTEYGHSSYRGDPLGKIEEQAFIKRTFRGHYEVNDDVKLFLEEWANTYTAGPLASKEHPSPEISVIAANQLEFYYLGSKLDGKAVKLTENTDPTKPLNLCTQMFVDANYSHMFTLCGITVRNKAKKPVKMLGAYLTFSTKVTIPRIVENSSAWHANTSEGTEFIYSPNQVVIEPGQPSAVPPMQVPPFWGTPVPSEKTTVTIKILYGKASKATFTIESEDDKKKRLEIRTRLGEYLEQATSIRTLCLVRPEGFKCQDQINDLLGKARLYIDKNLEPSYRARFDAATGKYLFFKNAASPEDNTYVNILKFKADALEQFIKELRD